MSMRDLLKELSQESEEVAAAEQVLNEGELLDGTPVSNQKESAIKEMMDHAEKARMMSSQLNELADKADEILKEDKVHLVNEIATEAFQMNYRHIMENAGLSDGVVNFESNDKVNELNYLSNEARKMAQVAGALEDRILDFSPEGKIWSFLRADSKRMAVARGDIETYGDKLIRRSKDSSVKKIPVTWTLLGNAKEWLVFKNGKAVNDLTAAIITDLELLIKSFDTVKKNNTIIRQIVADSKAGKAIDPNKMKQVKVPEIVDEHVLGDKHVKQDSGELSRMFGWTPANPPWWAVGLGIMFGPLGAIALAVGQKVNAKNAMENSNTHIDVNKIQRMLSLYKEAGRILDRDEHANFDSKEIDSVPGEQGRFLKTIAKNSGKLQGFMYEHMFFLTWGMAETMRGLDGSWDLFLGEFQV